MMDWTVMFYYPDDASKARSWLNYVLIFESPLSAARYLGSWD
uniref:Uncharacterized protein n=1 Tax=Arundo donax TaxID=35708 RepID=A0A0A9CDG4_ARUDO